MKRLVLAALILTTAVGASAQFTSTDTLKYRISLTDKAATTYSIQQPEEFLSRKSIDRRLRQKLAIDSTDLPVCKKYVDAIRKKGVHVLVTGKWDNFVTVSCNDSMLIDEIAKLPFVRSTEKVWQGKVSAVTKRDSLINDPQRSDSLYGPAITQIEMSRANLLHDAGFKGQGMTIAVIDAGFHNADKITAMQNIRIQGTKDFVNPQSDIFAESSHGMAVLSCIAMNRPGVMTGTAPEASFWLLRSEDEYSEHLVEQDYWAAAVEYADSVGVDVVSSSLGYFSFDVEALNYHQDQLDGRTSLISRAAKMASSKGILLFSSAGNEGGGSWGKITFPADAPDILTVGAITDRKKKSNFSSVGFTADYRVKPDVVALGTGCCVIDPTGNIRYANGTSFATPILAGLGVCLWQAFPSLTNKDIISLLQRFGSKFEQPDAELGYGIPDVYKAYKQERKYAAESK